MMLAGTCPATSFWFKFFYFPKTELFAGFALKVRKCVLVPTAYKCFVVAACCLYRELAVDPYLELGWLPNKT